MTTLRHVSNRCEMMRRKGHKIVLANGCFDVLHFGHLKLLKTARALGQVLVVGINSDASVAHLKGKGRPINNQFARRKMVQAIRAVSYVIVFDEPTPEILICSLQPDFLVKGGDYKVDEISEAPLVRELGGQVVIVPLVAGYSTTSIVGRESRRDEIKDAKY